MNISKMSLVALFVLLGLAAPHARAAHKDFQVKFRQAIWEDGRLVHQVQRQNFGFRVEIVTDSWGFKPESVKNGAPYITASRGERYSVRLYNPLPVRVAVNLTVDGLNSITGKPSGIADGQKWMIDPYSFITISGWQVNNDETRRFFFTGKTRSYAQWRGDKLGKDLAANCGVIGAAYFWSRKELDRYYEDHPGYRYIHHPSPFTTSREKACPELAEGACGQPGGPALGGLESRPKGCEAASAANDTGLKRWELEEQAGTGMGERESHPTYQVAFDYDTGMYSPSQAVIIYYGFEAAPVPNPFPALGYAPEQPLR